MGLEKVLVLGYALIQRDIDRTAVTKIDSRFYEIEKTFCDNQASGGSTVEYWRNHASMVTGGMPVTAESAIILPFEYEEKNKLNIFQSSIQSIKKIASLSNEEIAQVLCSGRKTVHNWMQNDAKKPNKSKIKRILEVEDIFIALVNSYGTDLQEIIHSAPPKGPNLLSLLSNEELNRDLIQFTASEIYLTQHTPSEIEDPFA
ncbi:hypothetical protein QX776_11010 [Alteromonadaceae bacterium BrNp21-10]|nr:hypothetical protein [Alteromonadaceae bacterium BrNp21-10]